MRQSLNLAFCLACGDTGRTDPVRMDGPVAYWLAQTILYIQVISESSNVWPG